VSPAAALRRLSLLDVLLVAALALSAWQKLSWAPAGRITLGEVVQLLFELVWVLDRLLRRDTRMPSTAIVLAGFGLLFLAVYLAGHANIDTEEGVQQWTKGIGKWAIFYSFIVLAAAHTVRRGAKVWWAAFWGFIAGFAGNAAYGTLQLGLLTATGRNLDTELLDPLFGGAKTHGLSLLGRVTNVDQFGGTTSSAVYRLTGFSEDPNHFGVLVNMPIMLLLALVLRARSGWVADNRMWLAALTTALFLAQLLSQSRSGLLGCAVGLLVLAIGLRRYLWRRELAIAVIVLALAASVVVVGKRDQLQQVLDSRLQTGDRSSRIHTDLYDLIPPVLESHPALGLGLNNFAVYYAFQTGKTDFGPHSFYIAVLTETGLIGGALYLAFLAWVISRLLVLLRAGRARSSLPDDDGLVAAVGWGFAAALAAILAGNLFYLTMIFNVHYCFLLLLLTAPAVLAPEPARAKARARLRLPGAATVPATGD
jgi:hypothetical protein